VSVFLSALTNESHSSPAQAFRRREVPAAWDSDKPSIAGIVNW